MMARRRKRQTRLHALTYEEQLAHPLWQQKSAEIKEAAHWRCEDCFSGDDQLSVHHCHYEFGKLLWEYDRTTLMCLCWRCHTLRQELEKAAKRAFAKILRRHSNNSTERPGPTDLQVLVKSFTHQCDKDYQAYVLADSFRYLMCDHIVDLVANCASVDANHLKSGAIPLPWSVLKGAFTETA